MMLLEFEQQQAIAYSLLAVVVVVVELFERLTLEKKLWKKN